jgi:hypothetical protein
VSWRQKLSLHEVAGLTTARRKGGTPQADLICTLSNLLDEQEARIRELEYDLGQMTTTEPVPGEWRESLDDTERNMLHFASNYATWYQDTPVPCARMYKLVHKLARKLDRLQSRETAEVRRLKAQVQELSDKGNTIRRAADILFGAARDVTVGEVLRDPFRK